MRLLKKLIRYVIKLDSWVNQTTCSHLYTKWAGQGIAFDDGQAFGTVRYKCLKCGKRFEKKKDGMRDSKTIRKEMAFREGSDSYKLKVRDDHGKVRTVDSNPYEKGSVEFDAWKRGFQLEAWRARDSK